MWRYLSFKCLFYVIYLFIHFFCSLKKYWNGSIEIEVNFRYWVIMEFRKLRVVWTQIAKVVVSSNFILLFWIYSCFLHQGFGQYGFVNALLLMAGFQIFGFFLRFTMRLNNFPLNLVMGIMTKRCLVIIFSILNKWRDDRIVENGHSGLVGWIMASRVCILLLLTSSVWTSLIS